MIRQIVQCDQCQTQENLVKTFGDGLKLPHGWVRVEANEELRHYCATECMHSNAAELAIAVRDARVGISEQVDELISKAKSVVKNALFRMGD